MAKIRVAIVGVGNCASSLVQGVAYYRAANDNSAGLMHWSLGGFEPSDVEFVLAYDIDERKVGQDLSRAIFAKPNCTAVFAEVPDSGLNVRMGKVLDGMADHMETMPAERSFVKAKAAEPDKAAVIEALRASGTEVLINFLPVGSEDAVKFYMDCALKAGVGVVNCMPVFIASDPEWEAKFKDAGLPIVGDDIKAQFGATIVHRALTNLMRQRGVRMDRTYQLNTGGNTDFLNMMDRGRLLSKKISKTEAVQSVMAKRLEDENIHVGPSDYVPWLNDNKLCFLRLEGALFGNVPMNIEVRLSVEDSPNSAGVVIDAIRCCKLALDRGYAGPLIGPSAFFCKHPPIQFTDDEAERMTNAFIDRASRPGANQSLVRAADANPDAAASGTGMQGLIIAAGQGIRMRDVARSKPLALINGVPLIERVIVTAHKAGVSRFVVVTGYEGKRLETFLVGLSARLSIPIQTVRNFAWKGANGLSVAAAEAHLDDRFVLMMADHLLDPTILADLIASEAGTEELVLAVDRRLGNPLVDLEDVTRVAIDEHGRIARIGKLMSGHDAYDTGVFLASKALIAAIREDVEAGGQGGLSDGVRSLAAKGLARTFDIGDRFWLDVDDGVAHGHAEQLCA
ncbi:MAG TPA: NTP transferase domain-containing protein [Methylosinus sp.]|jgi:myo-inositol-1-phosphate synthase|uniref:NTP transferase domain-containing protein n=1 Tax=Methylosinus sp. TaxID=427 RepID=UPI002F93607D|nr:NTP transferase domain-containing protein [Caulobacteraceae bacterium]